VSSNKDKPSYAKYAFMNAYNLSVLGGIFTVAAATQNWWVAGIGACLESLWMLFAPDSTVLQKTWFDKYHQSELDKARAAELDAKLKMLPPQEADRCHALQSTRDQILWLARDNPALTQDLLGRELAKLDQLVTSFVDLESTCVRYLMYLGSVDVQQLERDTGRFEQLVKAGAEEGRAVAQKNLAVLGMRRDRYAEIARDLQLARGQLDLIENTFRLLADQIVTMRSPAELGGQLDDLIDGVESIRQTARETEHFMTAVER